MTPLTAKAISQREREELITPFFAYLNRNTTDDGRFPGYRDRPKKFLYDYLREANLLAEENPAANEDSRLEVVYKAALKLLDKESVDELKFKRPQGTWSDKLIYTFSRRLNVGFTLPPEMARKINPSMEYGDRSPMEFLAERRNAIAHGRRSFEDGANDLTMPQIRKFAEVTIEYMQLAGEAFQRFLDERKFVAVAI